MQSKFWSGKRVFVTGHTGFKGSWLTLWLRQWGADVTGFSLAPKTIPNMFESCGVAHSIDSVFGDVRQLCELQNAIESCRPDIVFHLASQPLVRRSYEDPIETYTSNIVGTVNLYEAVRVLNEKVALVNITTDKCYENQEWVWPYREDDRLGGYDPYSASKACVELISQSYQKSFFNEDSNVALATARAGNVIGGGDWSADRLVPDIIEAAKKNTALELRYPNAIRPWQYVLEPLMGYLMLAERLYNQPNEFQGAWNFGPDPTSVKTVEFMARELTDKLGCTYSIVNESIPHEANSLSLDCSKAHSKLQWRPKVDVHYAIDAIVDWYLSYDGGADMRERSIMEINKYIGLWEEL